MSNITRFAAYAAAFEKSFESDDWTGVRPFFAEEAVYETGLEILGGPYEGREAILAYFKAVLDGFDRRFESREIALYRHRRRSHLQEASWFPALGRRQDMARAAEPLDRRRALYRPGQRCLRIRVG